MSLTPNRMAVLTAWADGVRRDVPRNQLAWLSAHGYVIITILALPVGRHRPVIDRRGRLTDRAWAALKREPVDGDFAIYMQNSGFSPVPADRSKILARKLP